MKPRSRASTRPYPKLATIEVTLELSGRTANDLMDLLETGLFGQSMIAEVAEELLREKLRELALQGWIKLR
jgi:hypothetical protein